MTDGRFDLSRRKLLGAMGTIGGAAALGGAGTMAFFSDTEEFANNQLVAGELDLKVDWQEHYSDWSADEADGIDTVSMEPGTDLFGFPSAAAPSQQSVFVSDPGQFLDNTAIEAFPDDIDATEASGEYDGLKERFDDDSDICDVDADLDEVLSSPLRTRGTFPPGEQGNAQTTGPGDPLVEISDVKPGDFGEVTFSFHICGNPGYVWLTAALREAAENGLTEPERNDPDEDGDADSNVPADVELLSEIRAAFWYDTGGDGIYGADYGDKQPEEGDNYAQDSEGVIQMGTLGSVLLQLQNDPFPLDAEPVSTTTSTTGSGSSTSTVPVLEDLDDADGDTDDDGDSYELYVSTEDEPFKSFVSTPSGKATPKNLNCGDYDNLLFDGMSLMGTSIEAEMLEEGMDYNSCAGLTVDSISDERGDSDLDTITLSTDNPVRVVSVKGGDEGENIYVFDQPVELDGVTFTTPTGQGISNIDVCCPVDGGGGQNGGGGQQNGDRQCFENSTTAYIGFEWWLPVDHANEIQTDSVSFDLGFYTEQCRHNDGELGNRS